MIDHIKPFNQHRRINIVQTWFSRKTAAFMPMSHRLVRTVQEQATYCILNVTDAARNVDSLEGTQRRHLSLMRLDTFHLCVCCNCQAMTIRKSARLSSCQMNGCAGIDHSTCTDGGVNHDVIVPLASAVWSCQASLD